MQLHSSSTRPLKHICNVRFLLLFVVARKSNYDANIECLSLPLINYFTPKLLTIVCWTLPLLCLSLSYQASWNSTSSSHLNRELFTRSSFIIDQGTKLYSSKFVNCFYSSPPPTKQARTGAYTWQQPWQTHPSYSPSLLWLGVVGPRTEVVSSSFLSPPSCQAVC